MIVPSSLSTAFIREYKFICVPILKSKLSAIIVIVGIPPLFICSINNVCGFLSSSLKLL